MADQIQWFLRLGEKVHGPFTSSQLATLAKQSKFGPEALVRKGVEGAWVPSKRVNGLFPQAVHGELIPAQKSSPPPAIAKPPSPPQVRPHAEVVSMTVTRSVNPPLVPAAPATPPAVQVARIPCPMCGEEIAVTAKKCRHCNEYLDGAPVRNPIPHSAPAAPTPSVNVVVNQMTNVGVQGKQWSRLVAMMLSLIVPGLGQLYKGQLLNGVVWFVLVVVGYFLLIIPGVVLHVLCILGAATGNPYR